MNQLSLALTNMPLTKDEKSLLARLVGWVPSGIGGMSYYTIKYQLGWSHEKASAIVSSLENIGLIWHDSWDGSWFVEEYYPKVEGSERGVMFAAFIRRDFEHDKEPF